MGNTHVKLDSLCISCLLEFTTAPMRWPASLLFQADLLSPQQLGVGIDTGLLFVFEKVPSGGCPREEGSGVNFSLAFTNNNVHKCTHKETCLIFSTILTGSFIYTDEETESQSQDSNPGPLTPPTHSSVAFQVPPSKGHWILLLSRSF